VDKETVRAHVVGVEALHLEVINVGLGSVFWNDLGDLRPAAVPLEKMLAGQE
jgi:hypothetical protein